MKKYLFLTLFLPVLIFGQTTKFNYMPTTQWVTSGTNLYYLLGNVGIGTSSPTTPLMVNGVISASGGNSTLWNDCLTISSAQNVTGAKTFMANKLLLDANGSGTRVLTLLATGTTVSKTITFPDVTGTVALISNIPTDIMTLTTSQNVVGTKIFGNGTFKLQNAAETYTTLLQARVSSSAKTINLPDSNGTVALLSNCGTPSNYVTLNTTQDISGIKTFSPLSLSLFNSHADGTTSFTTIASAGLGRTITFPDATGTVALTSDLPAASQWTTSGTSIYYNTGRVGVGITNPHQIFENKGTFQTTGGLTEINDSSNYDTKINTGPSTGSITLGGTSSGEKTVNVGSSTGASILNLYSGAGGMNMTGGGDLTIGVAGTIYFGGNFAQVLNIGTQAYNKTVNVGSTNTTSTTNISSGSGAINLNVGNSQPTNINTGTNTGTISIGGSNTPLNMNVASPAATNINTGLSTGSVTIGGASTQTISIGSVASGSITNVKTAVPGINVSCYSRLTGTVTTTLGSLTDITGLTMPLVDNAVYEFEANLLVGCNAIDGNRYGVNFNALGANVYYTYTGTYQANVGATGTVSGTPNTETATMVAIASTTTAGILIKGIITTGANTGTMAIRHKKVTAGGTASVYTGSYLKVIRIL